MSTKLFTDVELTELAIEHGFGTSLNEPIVDVDTDVAWFDGNPLPMLQDLQNRLTQEANEILVDGLNIRCWVNSSSDGSLIGRFDKRFGMDVHRTVTEQVAGKGECLHCTHGPAGINEWNQFRSMIKLHYGTDIPEDTLTF